MTDDKDKVCESCKHYDMEHGYCMKDKEWPVTTDLFETCDDWTPDDEEMTEAEEKSILADKEYQRYKENDL